MAEPIRYGIIGTGMMGCEHIRNILARDDAVVTAISDPDEASRRWGQLALSEGPGESADVAVFEDARALLEHAPVDAVVIASPNHTPPRYAEPDVVDVTLQLIILLSEILMMLSALPRSVTGPRSTMIMSLRLRFPVRMTARTVRLLIVIWLKLEISPWK